jgi:hypothetical protein
MNTDRGHMKTHQYGSGSGNRRDAWRTRRSPTPYRAAASRPMPTASTLLAGNASQQRYPRTRTGSRHHAAESLVERQGRTRR